jgi:hypothetical protein
LKMKRFFSLLYTTQHTVAAAAAAAIEQRE